MFHLLSPLQSVKWAPPPHQSLTTMDYVPVSSSFVRMCQTIHSEDININRVTNESHIRLGNVLKFMDICACLSIESLSKTSCVTASMDHLVFSNESVMPGEAMSIEASVVRTFNSSAEVVCRVVVDPAMSLHPDSGNIVRCLAHAFFVFVRLDHAKMPGVFPETKAETQAFELAMERRKARQYKHIEPPTSSSSSTEMSQEVEIEVISVSGEVNSSPHVAAGDSLLECTHIVLPPHANHMGNTFGGQILQWAEEAAVMSATMHINASRKVNNNVFHYYDSSQCYDDAKSWEDSGLTAITNNPNLLVSTVYVNGMSFLQPSSVGDRISFKSQACRTFGSVIEVEVTVMACDVVQSSIRHINTGYFVISCKDAESGMDVYVCPVLASTVEQQERHRLSLKRMMVASLRSASYTSTLDSPAMMNEFSSRSAFVQLSSMLRMQESSIWNSELPASLTLSPLFEIECASELALQDVSGLLSSLLTSDSWDRVPLQLHGTSLHIKNKGKREKIMQVKFTVEISARLEDVVAYVLDLSRRGEWDSILKICQVVKPLVSDKIDIVHMATAASVEKRGVDYCLLRCHHALEDGRVVIASRSIVYDGFPHDDSLYSRGELLPSGFVLTPVTTASSKGSHTSALSHEAAAGAGAGGAGAGADGRSSEGGGGAVVQMDYLLQLDRTSAELLSGDFKGHSNRILSSMSKLKQKLEKMRLQ